MKIAALLSLPFLLQLSSVALAEGPEAARFKVPEKEQAALAGRIEAQVRQGTGMASLKDFKVDWSTLRCLRAAEPMNPETELGTCLVRAAAFQVYAEAAVVKASGGYSATLVFADVE